MLTEKEHRMPGNGTPDPMYWFSFSFVVAGWFVFAVAFLLRRRPEASVKRVWNNRSLSGVVLMGIGMALVWWIRRPVGTAFIPASQLVSYVLSSLACCLTVGSISLILAAVRLLGKQWNVRAIVVDHHQLITAGPFAIVRHPIYSGMFGMMLATGFTNSYWYALLAAIVITLVGMHVRIRQEEKLLQQTFGADFERYQRAVPAFFPWPR